MEKRIGDLVLDAKLTKLRPINEFFVSRYRQAYRAGKDLGALLVEKGTNRIISSNHRATAMKAEFGEEHKAEVVVRAFADEQEVLRVFAEENSNHGNALSGASQHAITQELLSLGAEPIEVANIFGVSVRRIQEWAGLTVMVVGKKNKKEYRPAKRGLEPGTEMTEAQYSTHWKADRGISALAQAKQLMRWIDNGWITDGETIACLLALAKQVLDIYAEDKAV